MAEETPLEFIERYPESDRNWAREFLMALAWNEVSAAQSRTELTTALSFIGDSGQSASELFGSPRDYGQARAQALHTPEQRANTEYPVDSSTGLVAGVLGVVGLLCLGFGVWIGFRDGWMSTSWRYAQLACLVAGAGIGLSLHVWWFNRFKGRVRLAWVSGVLGCAASVGIAVPLAVYGAEQTMPLPNWLAPILGAGAVVVAFYLPTSAQDSTEVAHQAKDPDKWFSEARHLLRGRYGMSRKETKETLAPVRQHWIDATIDGRQRTLVEEFGTPNEFVIALGANTENPAKRRWLLLRLLPLCIAVVYGFFIVPNLLDAERSGWDIVIGLALVAYICFSLFELRPRNRQAYVAQKLSERRAHAQVLQEGLDD